MLNVSNLHVFVSLYLGHQGQVAITGEASWQLFVGFCSLTTAFAQKWCTQTSIRFLPFWNFQSLSRSVGFIFHCSILAFMVYTSELQCKYLPAINWVISYITYNQQDASLALILQACMLYFQKFVDASSKMEHQLRTNRAVRARQSQIFHPVFSQHQSTLPRYFSPAALLWQTITRVVASGDTSTRSLSQQDIPKSQGDSKIVKRGPKGDQILSKKGTFFT